MRLIGILGTDSSVPCATCNHFWDVNYLVRDLGRAKLRSEGFAYILFDDGAIMVNCCPRCDLPSTFPVNLPMELAAAA